MSIQHPDLNSGHANDKGFMDRSLRRRVERKRARTTDEGAGNNRPPTPPATLVAHHVVPETYTLVDGHHRLAALRALQVSNLLPGDTAVPKTVLKGSTPEVLTLIL